MDHITINTQKKTKSARNWSVELLSRQSRPSAITVPYSALNEPFQSVADLTAERVIMGLLKGLIPC